MRDGKIRAEGGDSGAPEIGAEIADLAAFRASREAPRASEVVPERQILCMDGHWHSICEDRVMQAICGDPVPECEVKAMLLDYLNHLSVHGEDPGPGGGA